MLLAANGFMEAGKWPEAIRIYEAVLERAPQQPRVWLSYGHILKTVGRQAEGVTAYRRAIALKHDLGEAWWSLANLKTVRFNQDDVDAMRSSLTGARLGEEDRFHLEFALGKAMHDLGRPEEAFGHFAPMSPEQIADSEAARLFDLVLYGDRPATEEHSRLLLALDSELAVHR